MVCPLSFQSTLSFGAQLTRCQLQEQASSSALAEGVVAFLVESSAAGMVLLPRLRYAMMLDLLLEKSFADLK